MANESATIESELRNHGMTTAQAKATVHDLGPAGAKQFLSQLSVSSKSFAQQGTVPHVSKGLEAAASGAGLVPEALGAGGALASEFTTGGGADLSSTAAGGAATGAAGGAAASTAANTALNAAGKAGVLAAAVALVQGYGLRLGEVLAGAILVLFGLVTLTKGSPPNPAKAAAVVAAA